MQLQVAHRDELKLKNLLLFFAEPPILFLIYSYVITYYSTNLHFVNDNNPIILENKVLHTSADFYSQPASPPSCSVSHCLSILDVISLHSAIAAPV